jgi:hypothetical protein
MFFSAQRKKQFEACRFILRLVDQTTPNLPSVAGEARIESRSNRTLPVILAPVENERAIAQEASFALTKDLTGHGLALVLSQPFHAEDVLIGFWNETGPGFVRGKLCRNMPLGGGFWQLGVEVLEVVDVDFLGLKPLVAMAERLVPEPTFAPA